MLMDHDVLSEIIPGRLYLTSLEVAKNEAILKEYNIDIIVSIIDFNPFEYNIPKRILSKQKVYFFAKDTDEFPLEQYFEPFYNLMESNPGKRVLVHCLVGMSRSASLVISYLIKKDLNSTFNDHYCYVKEARPCIDPNNGFIAKLREYRKHLKNL